MMNNLIKNNQSLQTAASLIACLIIGASLSSCGNTEGDDLDKFIKNSGKTMHTSIKPLPQVKPFSSVQYNADGTLTDPFRARKPVNNANGAKQPNLDRPKEPMEAFPLESLKYVGIISKEKLTYALLKTPDNIIQQVKIGNYVGQNYGIVENITDSEIVLSEVVQDDNSGDWIDRKSSLSLQE